MISKKYRLTEREVKKVLQRWKPFFSYGIVLNYIKNKSDYNRFAIVIWSKSVKTNVERNFFRRTFYDLVTPMIRDSSLEIKKTKQVNYDFIFVVKKQNKLDVKNKDNLKNFKKDIWFLLSKILK